MVTSFEACHPLAPPQSFLSMPMHVTRMIVRASLAVEWRWHISDFSQIQNSKKPRHRAMHTGQFLNRTDWGCQLSKVNTRSSNIDSWNLSARVSQSTIDNWKCWRAAAGGELARQPPVSCRTTWRPATAFTRLPVEFQPKFTPSCSPQNSPQQIPKKRIWFRI